MQTELKKLYNNSRIYDNLSENQNLLHAQKRDFVPLTEFACVNVQMFNEVCKSKWNCFANL